MPQFELRAREILETIYTVNAADERTAVEMLNQGNVRSLCFASEIVGSDLIVNEIPDEKTALLSCA